MHRINLAISDELFQASQNAAIQENISVNLVAIETLEQLFVKPSIDYSIFINKLITDIVTLPKSTEEFTLCNLKSYHSIRMFEEADGQIKPSTSKARIGKVFNEL